MEPKAVPTRDDAGDEWLLQRIRQRDPSALVELYDRSANVLYPILLRASGDEPSAAALLEELFVSIWKDLDGDRGGEPPLLWMVKRARHIAADARSRRVDTARAPQVGLHGVAADSTSITPRTVIDLAYFHGYSPEEIASNLRLSVSAVKQQIRAGMAELRRSVVPR